jgi:hypothetical protein
LDIRISTKRFFSSLQTGSGAHSASYPIGKGGFSKGKEAWGVELTAPASNAEVENVGAIPPFPHMYSWRGA